MLEKFNIDIPNSWLDGDKDNYFVLTVKDDGYMPYFSYGDVLIISNDISKIENNDIVLVEIDGNIELRRYITYKEDTNILEGITPFIPPQLYTGQIINGFLYTRITNYKQGSGR